MDRYEFLKPLLSNNFKDLLKNYVAFNYELLYSKNCQVNMIELLKNSLKFTNDDIIYIAKMLKLNVNLILKSITEVELASIFSDLSVLDMLQSIYDLKNNYKIFYKNVSIDNFSYILDNLISINSYHCGYYDLKEIVDLYKNNIGLFDEFIKNIESYRLSDPNKLVNFCPEKSDLYIIMRDKSFKNVPISNKQYSGYQNIVDINVDYFIQLDYLFKDVLNKNEHDSFIKKIYSTLIWDDVNKAFNDASNKNETKKFLNELLEKDYVNEKDKEDIKRVLIKISI